MDTAVLFQLCTLFAITLIIIIEIRLERDSTVWAPLLFAVVGYVLPQPRGVRRALPEFHEDERGGLVRNDLVPHTVSKENDDNDSGFVDDGDLQQNSAIDGARNMVKALWPTLLLLAGVAVWITVAPNSTTMTVNRYGNNDTELATHSDCEHHLATLFALAEPLDQCNRGDVACYERNRTLQDSRFSYMLGDQRSRPLLLLSEKIWSGLFAHASDLLRRNGLVVVTASTNDECSGTISIGKGEYARTCGDQIYLSSHRHRTVSIGRSELGRILDTASSLFHALISCPTDTLLL